ncbi:MAG: acyltransferase [Bacteroidales bacterium]
MKSIVEFKKEIFEIKNYRQFADLALYAFNYQYHKNKVYKEFCDLLKINPQSISQLTDIPFLPVTIFKNRKVVSGIGNVERTFSSSSTTGQHPSYHFVKDISLYEKSLMFNFEYFYGNPSEYTILALLPSYLERQGSSLVYMVEKLMEKSASEHNGFYLYDFEGLLKKIEVLEHENKKFILLGVSFALLDFAVRYKFPLKNGIVIETGGMKGRKREITREQLHNIICEGFSIKSVHSEYGMTELLSQAYSFENGIYRCPPQMKVLVRETGDPLKTMIFGKGALNIIDLANIDSCCFISTSDLGEVDQNAGFKVLGRFDEAEVRGCNLMVS